MVSGTVQDPAGQPLAGADAFLLETLEGSLTDDMGGFRFDTRRTGSATLSSTSSRPASSGGGMPAPGEYGFRMGSIVSSYVIQSL